MGRELYKHTYRTESLRLPWWDYSDNGDYFITIRASKKGDIFGKIKKNDIELNARGRIVKDYLLEIPDHFDNAILHTWVVMPDHVHLLLRIRNKRTMVETQQCCVSNKNNTKIDETIHQAGHQETQPCCVSTKNQELDTVKRSNTFHRLKPKSIPVIIRSYKSACTRKIHEVENNKQFKWQKSFYDKVIFNDQVLHEIEMYIRNNPQNHNK